MTLTRTRLRRSTVSLSYRTELMKRTDKKTVSHIVLPNDGTVCVCGKVSSDRQLWPRSQLSVAWEHGVCNLVNNLMTAH